MNWLIKTFNSSIGQKVFMSLTGLFLCSFLVIHLIGNFQLFKDDNGLSFNRYAAFMTSNPLIKMVSYGLYISILLHALKGFHLAYKNHKARPVKYASIDGKANSHWTSRSMTLLGTILLVFIVVHMGDFWWQYHNGPVPYTQYAERMFAFKEGGPDILSELNTIKSDTVPSSVVIKQNSIDFVAANRDVKVYVVKDLYQIVSAQFKNWPMVLFYVIAMFSVAFHLFHGFKSAFQSLGVNHAKYNGIIQFIGLWIFAIAIPAAFAAMPLYFFFK